MSSELEDLVVSGGELDKKLAAEVLSPYLRFDKDTCSIRPVEAWNELNANQKILLYLLARKAMVALGFYLAAEGATASEVVGEAGLKKGTVHPSLRNLLKDRMIDQSKDRRYSVPNYAVERIKAMLGQEQKGGQRGQRRSTKEN